MSLTCKKWGGLPVGSICDEFSDFPYIRVSNCKQTVENQRYEINQFCKREKLIIDGGIEESISGTQSYNKRKLGGTFEEGKKG